MHYVLRSVHCLFYSDKYRTCYLLVDSYWAKSASLSVVHTVADWLCFSAGASYPANKKYISFCAARGDVFKAWHVELGSKLQRLVD